MRKFLEFLGIHCHTWSKWEYLGKGKIYDYRYSSRPSGTYIDQRRECITCGFIQEKRTCTY